MKKHEAPPATISDRLNPHRRQVVLELVERRPEKVDAHQLATCDRAGYPDGGTRSAILGHVCVRCGLSRDAILDLKGGGKCDTRRARFVPLAELDGVPAGAEA